jgi:hypothetical protein
MCFAHFLADPPKAFWRDLAIFLQGKKIGGEGGIRTHGPGFPGQPISSRPRYDHFGTSPAIPAERGKRTVRSPDIARLVYLL